MHSSRQTEDFTMGYLPPPQKKCPSPWGIWTPSNTLFLGPVRVHNPNGITIGSAVFAGFTAERPILYNGSLFPQDIAPSREVIWTPI